MKSKKFDNVWDAIESDPEVAKLTMITSSLMMKTKSMIEKNHLSINHASQMAKVPPEKIADILHGNIHRVELEELMKIHRDIANELQI